MNKNIVYGMLALALVGSIAGCSSTTAPTNSTQTVIQQQTGASKKAPDFKLTDLNGKQVSLSDFKGKPIYLNLWASWCPPCRAEMPEIEKLYQETKNTDLVILAVNLGDSTDVVQKFMSQNKLNFIALADTKNIVGDMYQANAIPVSVFIDRNGNIVDKRVGGIQLTDMEQCVQEIK